MKNRTAIVERRTFGGMEFRVDRSGEKPRIVGHAARFNTLSEPIWGIFREKIAPGAFADALKISDIRALFNHNPDKVLGRNKSGTLQVEEDEAGLRYDIDPPDTQTARDLIVSIDRGDISQSSFAFTVAEGGDEWDDSGDMPIRTITRVQELFDVSPVTYPAYKDSSVGMRSEQAEQEERARETYRRHREVLEAQAGGSAAMEVESQARLATLRNIEIDIMKMGVDAL